PARAANRAGPGNVAEQVRRRVAHDPRATSSHGARPRPGAVRPFPGGRIDLLNRGCPGAAGLSSRSPAHRPVGGRPMKTASAALPLTRSRLADYVELTKPRISILVLFTVAAGGWLAGLGEGDGLVLLHTVCATALVAAGASALNHLLERHTDALMQRTENRPLPAGRLHPAEVLVFGLLLAIAGLAYMAAAVRQPLAVALTAFTFVSY